MAHIWLMCIMISYNTLSFMYRNPHRPQGPNCWWGLIHQQEEISLHEHPARLWCEWSDPELLLKIPRYFASVMQVYLTIGCHQQNLTTGIFYVIAVWKALRIDKKNNSLVVWGMSSSSLTNFCIYFSTYVFLSRCYTWFFRVEQQWPEGTFRQWRVWGLFACWWVLYLPLICIKACEYL